MDQKVIDKFVGRTILDMSIITYQEDKLCISFVGGGKLLAWDDGQSCCEQRYMNTDDTLADFKGARFLGMEVRDGPTEDDGNILECEFLLVHTSLGTFTVANYNSHNGYYGGFWLKVNEVG